MVCGFLLVGLAPLGVGPSVCGLPGRGPAGCCSALEVALVLLEVLSLSVSVVLLLWVTSSVVLEGSVGFGLSSCGGVGSGLGMGSVAGGRLAAGVCAGLGMPIRQRSAIVAVSDARLSPKKFWSRVSCAVAGMYPDG